MCEFCLHCRPLPSQPASLHISSPAAGTRLLGLIIGGLAIPQPPAVLAATQAVLLLCCQNNAGYCGTRLLADPLSGRRAQWLAVALDYLSLPVLAALEPALVQQGATHGHPGGASALGPAALALLPV